MISLVHKIILPETELTSPLLLNNRTGIQPIPEGFKMFTAINRADNVNLDTYRGTHLAFFFIHISSILLTVDFHRYYSHFDP